MKTTGREYTRMKVRERDNFTCQECKSIRTPEEAKKERRRLFDVHHLNGLCGKLSRSYDRIKDIDGLITLCHKCHFSKHYWRNGLPTKVENIARDETIYRQYMSGASGTILSTIYKITHQRIYQIIDKKRLSSTKK